MLGGLDLRRSPPLGVLVKAGYGARSIQFLPPRGFRPMGPTVGPNWILTPFPRASAPRARPLAYARALFQVAPTVIPAGKAVLRSVFDTPKAESCKQRFGIPNRGADPVFPAQGPMYRPVPVVKLTFSAKVILATTFSAFAYAADQSATHPPGGVG